MMRPLLAWSSAVIFCAVASASDLAIIQASVAPSSHQALIGMSVVNPPIDVGTGAAKQWVVEIDDADGKPIPGVAVANVAIGTNPANKPTNIVILDLPATINLKGWTSITVTYTAGGSKTYRFLGAPADKAKTIVGADTKDDADVYVSGTYAPRIHSPAQYTYDVSIGYGLPYFSPTHPRFGRAGLSIIGAADSRPNLDPDSYFAGAFWQAYPVIKPRGVLQAVLFQLDGGGEFARKKYGDTKTKTSGVLAPAPRFEFPMRLYPVPGASLTGVFITARPLLGLDYGKNFQNALLPSGSGFMLRGLAGLDLAMTYKPKKLFLYSLTASTSWRGRFLARKEIDTTSHYDPAIQDSVYTFGLSQKPRNHVESKVDWKWTEYFGLTITHELGALPPLFNYVDHSVTVSLTFSGSFAKDGVQRRQ